ncbi:EamA family transporter [Chryseobacterium phosphatilyticum]|uniref:EamA family transporter n=1 Tax=Chryseobacterium phosphatilyticum TaxID=475075 RepID=A0A316XCI9_9FLAO|nr:DMT family transporter [Chryseobacterium phosphatilyticum]PWN71522.1 EamA family transporter [Chryseobacterium phosphatilyticum]
MKKSYLLLHLAVILAGFTGVFGKLITLNEGLLVWYRLLFSAIILFFILHLLGIRYTVSFKDKIQISRAGLLLTLHWLLFYASIKYANISIGVVCYCLTSFFTAVFKPLLDNEKFKVSELLLSTLTLAGISLIFHFDTSYQLGITLGVFSSAVGALYTIYNKRLVQHFDTKVINYYQMVAGTLCWGALLPVYLLYFQADSIVPGLKDTAYLGLLSFFCTVGLYVAFAEVLKYIPAFTVNLTYNLEPVYAIMMAFLFFGESKEVNLSFYIGLVFIIASVVLQTIISLKKAK